MSTALIQKPPTNGDGATAPGDELPGNRQLDDALNDWAASGLALLRRIRERRSRLVTALNELDALEARTREAIATLAARGEPVEP
jgi:hypothetical protein